MAPVDLYIFSVLFRKSSVWLRLDHNHTYHEARRAHYRAFDTYIQPITSVSIPTYADRLCHS